MKRGKFLLWVLAALALTGCSLARAEAEPANGGGDRWVGFYVMPSQGYVDHLADNPYTEEYGAFTAETEEFGNLSFPREVLFAVEDEVGNYAFPGLEGGYSLFVYRQYEEETDHGGLDYSTGVVSNMAPGEEGFQIRHTDEGIGESFSGTIYYTAPLGIANWDEYTSNIIWRFYRVFQARDGRIYLDGSGDSSNGSGSITNTVTRTRTENGETYTDTVSATVTVKAIQRLERLTVTQFDGDNVILQAGALDFREDNPELRCLPETAWVLVEEVGPEETVRTVYNVPETDGEPVSHLFIRMNDEGYGLPAYLLIYPR